MAVQPPVQRVPPGGMLAGSSASRYPGQILSDLYFQDMTQAQGQVRRINVRCLSPGWTLAYVEQSIAGGPGPWQPVAPPQFGAAAEIVVRWNEFPGIHAWAVIWVNNVPVFGWLIPVWFHSELERAPNAAGNVPDLHYHRHEARRSHWEEPPMAPGATHRTLRTVVYGRQIQVYRRLLP